MKEVKLTQGKVALVDDGDFERVSKHKWHAHKEGRRFYALTNMRMDNKNKKIGMHVLVFGVHPTKNIDHINHNGLDNRRCNLRFCTKTENQGNRRPTLSSPNMYKGITFHKKSNKWQAQIEFNHIPYYLGCYPTQATAAQAYNKKAKELFGDFAYPNNIKGNK